jgi:hypothetical protein
VLVASYEQLQHYDRNELEGKTVITAAISEERLEDLADKGVRLVLDCSIQPFRKPSTSNLVEAAVMAALDKPADEITHDDYLEIFTDLDLKPRIIYPIEGIEADQPLCLCHSPAVTAVFQQSQAPGAGVEVRPGTGDGW